VQENGHEEIKQVFSGASSLTVQQKVRLSGISLDLSSDGTLTSDEASKI